jgi:hypothetical protein
MKERKPPHVVLAETDESPCIIVTAYIPDPALWQGDYKSKIH